MAKIKPFAAVRPSPPLAARVCELPYDVMSAEEARELAAGNPLSFLRVSRPEIEFPLGTDPYSAPVYKAGRANFQRLLSEGALKQDPQPCFHLYRQTMGSHVQTGIVAVASCAEYLSGDIRKHELTRPDKEDDRVRHIEALEAQTGPVFLTYRAHADVDELVARLAAQPPAVDFTAADAVRHTAWVVVEETDQAFIQSRFADISRLYIADGHHRSAAAARVFQARKGTGHSAWFLAVLFPHDQLRVLPYNRVLRDLNGLSPEDLLERLTSVFRITPEGDGSPRAKGCLALYLAGKWHSLEFQGSALADATGIEGLDVSLLQRQVLGPVLGIEDPRTSRRIGFVGGIRGTEELRKLVDTGEYACAFSMFPTSVEDLMTIADQNEIMPPKSTWFEPKLRDAMFCHRI